MTSAPDDRQVPQCDQIGRFIAIWAVFFKASGDNISAQFAIEICLGDFGDFAIDIGRLYKACSENILAHFSIEICLW